MRLIYLTANAAWVFVFGDGGHIIRVGDGPLFYEDRCAAIAAAEDQGLKVDHTGSVSADGPNPFEEN